MMLLMIVAMAVAVAPPAPPPAPEKPAYEPTSNYTVQNVEGWTIYVNNRLLNEKKELWDRTRQVLAAQLLDITRQVPGPALEGLRKVRIWVEAESSQVRCMCYHPSREWLLGHGFNPDKARSVELGNPQTFLDWTRHQRAMVLHELAHGYHHQVLGYDNADIKAAYKHAMEAKLYESVLFFDGTTKPAYAANNDQEYFAELSEAWFGTNDFYPFVRGELLQELPEVHKLLEEIWGRVP